MGFTNIIKMLSGKGKTSLVKTSLNKVFAFHGPFSGGKSTMVMNLGVLLSQEYKKNVLIIDTNIQYPYIRTIIGSNSNINSCLLNTYLVTEVRSLINKTKYDNLMIADVKDNSVLTLLSPKDNASVIDIILNSVLDDFDYVLIDVASETTDIAAKSLVTSDVLIQVIEHSARYETFKDSYEQYLKLIGVPVSKSKYVVFNKVVNTDVDLSSFKNNVVLCNIPYIYKVSELELDKQLLINNIGMAKLDRQVGTAFNTIAEFIVTGGILDVEVKDNQ